MTRLLASYNRSICLFFVTLSILFVNQQAFGFSWPFDTTAFEKKITAKDLKSSTQFYAHSFAVSIGQIWDETQFLNALKKQNYRIRKVDEFLINADAKKLANDECAAVPVENFKHCWQWLNRDGENYTVYINNENIVSWIAFNNNNSVSHWKAHLDPIQIAQFKNNSPIMQIETPIADIPIYCLNATMAIEDSEFLQHSGVSYLGMTRSLLKNLVKLRYAQGGSTITQQLVKNYFLTPEKTLKRKLIELYLATKLEKEWTKDEILETYLNIIYMGQNGGFQVLGFGAAANYYFNKNLDSLNLAECSLLAAIINNPGKNNPWKNSDNSLKRRNLVLGKMLEHKLINNTDYANALTIELPKQNKTLASETAPYFLEAAMDELKRLNLSENASKVYTSLDLPLQQISQTALTEQIKALEKKRKNLVKNKTQGLRLEGLSISSENSTGLINAFVGGTSFKQTQFNRALNSSRQIGSLVKPFVYLAAIEKDYSPEEPLNNQSFQWVNGKNKWSPENYDKKTSEPVPFFYALKESLNIPTAWLAQKLGINSIIATAEKAGFTTKISSLPSSSLGASNHNPIEIINAYRTLANLGKKIKSSFIEKIYDRQNKVAYEFKPSFETVFSETHVAVINSILKLTLLNGTAKSAKNLNWTHYSAGKTGTTSNNIDSWFVGYTPYQTTLVWLGYDASISTQLTGGQAAVPIWVQIMKSQNDVWPNTDFKMSEKNIKKSIFSSLDQSEVELIF